MLRRHFALLALCSAGGALRAQETSPQCSHPDTIAVQGNQRVSAATVITDAGIAPGDTLNYRAVQRAVKALYASGQFSDVHLVCNAEAVPGKVLLQISVTERPMLESFRVEGIKVASEKSVHDRIEVQPNRPLDASQVAKSVQKIDSMYEAKGYYLAKIRAETTEVGGKARLTFHIEEGSRLAVSEIDIIGNKHVSDEEIVAEMKTKPEGFLWSEKGEFDPEKFANDLGDHIPKVYQRRGYIDFQVIRDTLIVDRQNGKATLQIEVDEGPQYHIGRFESIGNRRFSNAEMLGFYPFGSLGLRRDPTITQRVKGLFSAVHVDKNAFDATAWDDATQKLRSAYSNDGYIYAQIHPVTERTYAKDSSHVVNLRLEIDEKSPATINRVEIAGNDYTVESCIRDQLLILPGDVFNQDRLVRSYQNIANLGFFETPLPPPDTRPANDSGDVDIIFRVKEKRTGNINLGASVGQGTGLGGFIGLTQPNLFGACKQGNLNWQFGRYQNNFSLSYTDPAFRQTRISTTVTAYKMLSRYIIGNLGQNNSLGASVQFGFPFRGSRYTRLYLSYGAEAVKYTGGIYNSDSLSAALRCAACFRSTVGLTLTHDTRIDLPFPSAGDIETFTGQFNGGILGGDANFQRYTMELRSYNTVSQFGGGLLGQQPLKLIIGLTARSGFIFGNTGGFFSTQNFVMGGTQYGEPLRGYEEFSITPAGILPGESLQPTVASFGNAYLSTTAELGLRINSMLYTDLFFDAGNVWAQPREFDPTRLYRGAGIGVALVTPLGPLGLDWAYGFDRVNVAGRSAPAWKLHFRLGNLF